MVTPLTAYDIAVAAIRKTLPRYEVNDFLTAMQIADDGVVLFGKAETMAQLGIVTAADLAEAVVFLASPAAARMTGQTISITGGISAI